MTAKDLLHLIFEYRYLWSQDHAANSAPGKARLQQIYALQAALGLSKANAEKSIWQKLTNFQLPADKTKPDQSNIDYLVMGSFIHERPRERNAIIDAQMKSKIESSYLGAPYWEGKEIPWLFNKLFHYRQAIYNATYPATGMLEGFSYGVHYANYLIQQVNETVYQSIETVDETLWLILDPEKRDISQETLVRDFGYPDVDLKALEDEWLMDNY